MACDKIYQPLFRLSFGFILGMTFTVLFMIQFPKLPMYGSMVYGSPRLYGTMEYRTQNWVNKTDEANATKYSPHNVRVLCWVMTSNANLAKKAIHVKQTWLKRCDIWFFIAEKSDAKFPALGFDTPAGRGYLTEKTMAAYDYFFKHHINDADWFLKADDDTYVIMENLKYMLSATSPEYPIYYGHPLTTNNLVNQGYNSGGAGYVLSRKALQLFGNRDKKACSKHSAEDVTMGRCMEKLGVKVGDGRDKFNRTRFHMDPVGLFVHKSVHFPLSNDGWKRTPGLDYVSDYAITFHHLKPEQLHELEYYTYRLTAHGHSKPTEELNKPPHVLFHKYH